MRRVSAAFVVLVAVCLLAPSTVFAQASITGVVKDTSGAVLPGVTVEAASPALIEKVRSATTDSDGTYRIVDLRAGTYTLTFSLPGFTSVKRDGIVLSGAFVASVNADMKVGQLEETIVVTGETPIVDVQSVNRQTTMDNGLINSIPAARSYGGLMTLMPNTVVQGGAASQAQVVPAMVVFGGAGGRSNEGRLQVDGLSVGTAFNGAGVSAYVADVNNAAEVVLTASGGMGEAEAGGPTLNLVPKQGGNSIAGSAYLSHVTKGMIGSNYTQALKDRGLTTPGTYTGLYDYNLGIGGPIKKDKIWWFLQVRNEGYENTVPGMFANKNANLPNTDRNAYIYVPDRSRPAYQAANFQTSALRITGQLTPKNKLTGLWDEQTPCEGAGLPDSEACRHSKDNQIICAGAPPTPACSATSAPEVGGYRDVGQRIQQLRWTSTATNNLLLEAGLGTYMSRWGGEPIPGTNPDLIRVQDQCTGNIPGTTTPVTSAGQPCEHGIANINFRAPSWGSGWVLVMNFRGSASLVKGGHNMKVGYQGSHLGDTRTNYNNPEFLNYRLNNAVPNQFTQLINFYTLKQRVRTTSFYGQDAWTTGRITLQGALRFDHAWSYFPEQFVPRQKFFAADKTYPFTKGPSYNDLTPRGGVAIDVFGNGKTSVKFNAGRYLEAAQNGGLFIANNPTGRLQTTSARTWTDSNTNFRVDCDLNNQASQNLSAAGGDICGQGNANFGTDVVSSSLDPTLQSGWSVRSGDWQWGAALQQQILPRVSAEVTYQRRWLVNFTATDNLNLAATDFDRFSVIVPSDGRLPNGGGGTIDGVYNITAVAATRTNNNVVTLAKNLGEHKNSTDSVSLNVTARPKFGLTLQGGFNYAKTNIDRCEVRSAIPEYNDLGLGIAAINPTNPWCAYATELLRATALGTYTVPKADVQVGFTFRSDQGAPLSANYVASPSNTTLGRNFAGGSTTLTVNLIEPGTLYGDRVNQLDFRVGKILRFGRTTSNVALDVFNVLNANPVLTYNESFSPTLTTWLRPNSVLQARFVKVSAQIGF